MNRSSICRGVRFFLTCEIEYADKKPQDKRFSFSHPAVLAIVGCICCNIAHEYSSSRCFLCVPLPLRCGIFPYRASFSNMYCDVLSTEVDSSSYWIAIYQSLKTNRVRLLCRLPCKASFFSYTLIGIPRFLFNSVGDSILGQEVSALEKLDLRALTAWTVRFSYEKHSATNHFLWSVFPILARDVLTHEHTHLPANSPWVRQPKLSSCSHAAVFNQNRRQHSSWARIGLFIDGLPIGVHRSTIWHSCRSIFTAYHPFIRSSFGLESWT